MSPAEAAQLIDLGPNTVVYSFSADGEYICGSANGVPAIWSVPILETSPTNPNKAKLLLSLAGAYSYGEARGMGLNGHIAGTVSTQPNLSILPNNQTVWWNAANPASISFPAFFGTTGRTSAISADGGTILVNETSSFNVSFGANYSSAIEGIPGQALAVNQSGKILVGASGSNAVVWEINGEQIAVVNTLSNSSWHASSLTGAKLAGQILNSGQTTSIVGIPQANIGSAFITSLNSSYQPLVFQHATNDWGSDVTLGFDGSGSVAVGQYVDSTLEPHGFRATLDKDSGTSGNDGSAISVEDWIAYKAGTQYSNGAATSGLTTYNAVATNFDGNAVVGQLNDDGVAGNAYLAIVPAGSLVKPSKLLRK